MSLSYALCPWSVEGADFAQELVLLYDTGKQYLLETNMTLTLAEFVYLPYFLLDFEQQ